jgi:uncharacterized Tic20 family protein
LLLFTGTIILLILLPLLLLLDRYFGADIRLIAIFTPLISILPMIAIGFFAVYEGVRNTIRVLSDQPYNYPLSIPFIK